MICLIDGNGAVFSPILMNQGHKGGVGAATTLSKAIADFLATSHGLNKIQLSIYVFLDRKGLVEAFKAMHPRVLKEDFDEFIIGFNQSANRFLMVDVGDGKKAAVAKMKGLDICN